MVQNGKLAAATSLLESALTDQKRSAQNQVSYALENKIPLRYMLKKELELENRRLQVC